MNIMHTMASEARPKVPRRRFYSPEFKLQAVGSCARAGASIAGVALKHGVNINIVHRWLREHSQGTLAIRSLAFMPVTLTEPSTPPPPEPPADIRIEVHRARKNWVANPSAQPCQQNCPALTCTMSPIPPPVDVVAS